MPSVQARHSRSCRIRRPWTSLTRLDGCTCPRGPLYHVVVRSGKNTNKEPISHNLDEALEALKLVEAKLNIERQRVLNAKIGRRTSRTAPSVGKAYSDLRLLIGTVDALIPDAQPWAKPNLKDGLAMLYRAEDALTRALKEGGV